MLGHKYVCEKILSWMKCPQRLQLIEFYITHEHKLC